MSEVKPTEAQLKRGITPDDPDVVNPSGEFGPDSYIDTGAYSPAKYPNFQKRKKKKSDTEPKKSDEEPKKKARKKLTLDIPKAQGTLDKWLYKPKKPTRVRFSDRVMVKTVMPCFVGLLSTWTTIPIRGYSYPNSDFAMKRKRQRIAMKHNHILRKASDLLHPSVRRSKIAKHIHDTLTRENRFIHS